MLFCCLIAQCRQELVRVYHFNVETIFCKSVEERSAHCTRLCRA